MDLRSSLVQLLSSGGDSRLAIDPDTLLNSYGCSVRPRPSAYTFASSTATSISELAYEKVAAERDNLLSSACPQRALEVRLDRLREELIEILQLNALSPEVIWSPSGTDSQLHAVFIARSLDAAPVVSILVAADETGSGAPYAAKGSHYANVTARGIAVAKGTPILGIGGTNELVCISLRDAEGRVRAVSEVDAEVRRVAEDALGSGRRVILHAMDCSKLGGRAPSLKLLRAIKAEHGACFQIVVDACQGRTSRARIAAYLALGSMVVLTGSKFFTGPPFSGALLVPREISRPMESISDLPSEFAAYTESASWPRNWSGLRARLPAGANVGVLFRWIAAIEEMRMYFKVPLEVRSSELSAFYSRCTELMRVHSCVDLLPPQTRDAEVIDEEMSVPTIVPFTLRTVKGDMNTDEARIISPAPVDIPSPGTNSQSCSRSLCDSTYFDRLAYVTETISDSTLLSSDRC